MVERHLLEGPMRSLLDAEGSGLASLLRDDKLEDLTRLFALFRRVPGGCETILRTTEEWVMAQVRKLLICSTCTSKILRLFNLFR